MIFERIDNARGLSRYDRLLLERRLGAARCITRIPPVSDIVRPGSKARQAFGANNQNNKSHHWDACPKVRAAETLIVRDAADAGDVNHRATMTRPISAGLGRLFDWFV
jgi:hypothetical protein